MNEDILCRDARKGDGGMLAATVSWEHTGHDGMEILPCNEADTDARPNTIDTEVVLQPVVNRHGTVSIVVVAAVGLCLLVVERWSPVRKR